MTVYIPFYPKSDKAQPLKRAIKKAAADMGVTDEAMTIAMTHFLECVTDEVALGSQVRIPGFGMFSGCTTKIKGGKNVGKPRRCKPFFYPARTFGYYVAQACPIALGNVNRKGHDKFLRRHNVGDPEKVTCRATPRDTMRRWRQTVFSKPMVSACLAYL